METTALHMERQANNLKTMKQVTLTILMDELKDGWRGQIRGIKNPIMVEGPERSEVLAKIKERIVNQEIFEFEVMESCENCGLYEADEDIEMSADTGMRLCHDCEPEL